MKKIARKLQRWLAMETFVFSSRFEKNYKWKIYNFIDDIYSPIDEEYTLIKLYKRNKWVYKISLIPVLILVLGILIGSAYKEEKAEVLRGKYDKISNVANHFYKMNLHAKDSLFEMKTERDSLMCYFNSREWIEYVIYKESSINIPKYLPDSIFFFMLREKKKYDIPNSIYWRLVFKESAFKMVANKTSGAFGYMQVMPATYNHYMGRVGVDSLHTPYNNIKVGSYILNEHYKRFIKMGYKDKRSWELALSAYNAGIGNVMRCGYNIPNFKETKDYVSFILRRYKEA